MKAEVFVQAGNQDVIEWIRDAVAEFLDPRLPIDVITVNLGSLRDSLSAGTRYSQLLQASIPPELGLKLEVKALVWESNRIYIRVYWPVFIGFFSGSYYYSEGGASFFPHQFQTFFPAVAIRDRMLLVPAGHLQTLENVRPGQRSPDQVIEHDLIEVDFADKQAVGAAIHTAGSALAAQLKLELGAWSTFQPPGALDLHVAATDLDVQFGILQSLLKDEVTNARQLYEQVGCELDSTSLPQGRWTRVTLTMRNQTDVDMIGVRVDVEGPVDVRPSEIIVDLPAGLVRSIPVALRPVDPGEFPIEIMLVQEHDALLRQWLPPRYLWLRSTERG